MATATTRRRRKLMETEVAAAAGENLFGRRMTRSAMREQSAVEFKGPQPSELTPRTATTRRRRRGRGDRSSSRSHLPADIVMFEILTWLPARTLLRLKCVCKDWHRLISGSGGGGGCHHRFAAEQFDRSLRRPSPASSGTIFMKPDAVNMLPYKGFDGTSMELPVLINPPSSSGHSYMKNIVTSTNGLCCFLCTNVSHSNVATPFIYICNPFNGRSGEQVPLPHGESIESLMGFTRRLKELGGTKALALAFEPSQVGYKLVKFDCISSGHRGQCDFLFSLYSSGSSRWVESRSKLTTVPRMSQGIMTTHSRTFYSGGKAYWNCWSFAVEYDVERDAAQYVEMPKLGSVAPYSVDQQIELREGRLTCTRLLNDVNLVEIWVLMGDKKWRCKKRIRIPLYMQNDSTISLELEGATLYEDEERRPCIQLLFDSCRIFQLGIVHYNISEKKLVRAIWYKDDRYETLFMGAVYRHHGILHHLPSQAMF